MPQRVTDSVCVVCGGKIVELLSGKDQWHDVVSYHCGSCGLTYRFLPKRIKRR